MCFSRNSRVGGSLLMSIWLTVDACRVQKTSGILAGRSRRLRVERRLRHNRRIIEIAFEAAMLTINEIFHSIQGESSRAGQLVRVRAADRLRPALLAGATRRTRSTRGARCRWTRWSSAVEAHRLSARRDHRRRAAAAGRRLPADGSPAGRRPHRDARDRRPSADRRACRRRSLKIVDVKCPAQRRGREERLEQPRPARAARRGQVRHPGSRRLRVRARRHRAPRPRRRVPPPSCCRRCTACSIPGRCPEWMLADRLAGAAAAAAAQVHLVADDERV